MAMTNRADDREEHMTLRFAFDPDLHATLVGLVANLAALIDAEVGVSVTVNISDEAIGALPRDIVRMLEPYREDLEDWEDRDWEDVAGDRDMEGTSAHIAPENVGDEFDELEADREDNSDGTATSHMAAIAHEGEVPPRSHNGPGWYENFQRERQMRLTEAPLPVHPRSTTRVPPGATKRAGEILKATEEDGEPNEPTEG